MLANREHNKNIFSMLYSDDKDDKEEDMCYESKVTEEKSCFGALIGGGHSHRSELKVLNYKQAMKSNETKEWEN